MVRLSFSSFVLCISWVQHQVYWFFSLWTLLYCQPREKWINLSFCYRNTIKRRCTDEIETGRHRVRFWTTHVSNSISEIRGWFFWFSSAKQPIHFGAKDMPSFLVDDKTTLSSLRYIFSVSVMKFARLFHHVIIFQLKLYNNDVMLWFWPWRTGRNNQMI